MILLDTNLISEMAKSDPNPSVVFYLRALPPAFLFTAALCEAELRYGIAKMPAGRRRLVLSAAIDRAFARGFLNQVLPFDRNCAQQYAEVRATREAAGKQISVSDAMIAATARAHGAALATRNVAHFEGCGLRVDNPWSAV